MLSPKARSIWGPASPRRRAGSGAENGAGIEQDGERRRGRERLLRHEGRSEVDRLRGRRLEQHEPSYPGIARTRFGRVKLELFKTISQMTEEQKFFVIFFADDALPMPARNLVPPRRRTRNLCMEWIGGIRTFGNTEPQNAVVMALKLKPDIIYFLTDGNFDRDTVKSAKRHNPTKIPIHTIGFGDNTGEVRMKEIAELTGGTYRFIPEEQPTQQAAAPEPDKTAKP